MSLEVASAIDLGTHCLFICDVVEGENIVKGNPMTYADYRNLKMGKPITSGDTSHSTELDETIYTCTVCHYVYDGNTPFEELDKDWTCPVCNQPKTVFLAG